MDASHRAGRAARCRRTSAAGDVTTQATVAAEARARALITQKAPGVIYGLEAAETAFALLDPDARAERLVAEGVLARGRRAGAVGGGARARAADAASAPR